MDPREVPEIREAVALLEGYEAAPLSYGSAEEFALAIETLVDYLSQNPDSPHRQFIQNLRFSYTRRMFQRLSSIKKTDVFVSLEHILLVVHTVKAEAEKLMVEYPDLEQDFDALIKVWGEPLARALIEEEDLEKARAHDRPTHT